MELILAILIGVLFAAGTYLLLRRSIVKLVMGIVLISYATNLILFNASGLVQNGLAFLNKDGSYDKMTDPLPQALILTAIVIGFGLTAFLLALKYKFFKITGTDDLDQLKETDAS
ncbi:MAG: Na+/H+ antiporter subunit C [Bacteroidetes bacterium]|jgi:multicomponent Na+:H+ antiporter subunit C|nr:Na+/H+ antiporter subunit C [Bacteroidota bacterium]